MIALDKVFEIGPYFRAENSHTVRHLSEFTSVDLEASFLDYQDVMDIIEKVIRKIVTELHENYKPDLQVAGAKEILVTNIERLTYEQCLEELAKEGEKLEFGDDLSDSALRRLGSLHPDFTSLWTGHSSLSPFTYMKRRKTLGFQSHLTCSIITWSLHQEGDACTILQNCALDLQSRG